MKLSKLAQKKGVYVDAEVLISIGHYSAYIDGQYRVVLSLGSREAGEEFLHRFLMPGAKFVDHINGNPTDNRKENLRECTLSQNQGNRKLNENNTSGYKGVRWHKAAKKWQARINYKNAEIYLGLFKTAELAALAYNTEALKLFGEFAKLNKVIT